MFPFEVECNVFFKGLVAKHVFHVVLLYVFTILQYGFFRKKNTTDTRLFFKEKLDTYITVFIGELG